MKRSQNPDLDSNLSLLAPREKPDPAQIIAEMRAALIGAFNLNFLERMEHCHAARYCYWEFQSWLGRKGVHPDMSREEIMKVFPWPGAADNRVPLIDELINERRDLKIASYDQAQRKIGPRNLDPDQQKDLDASMWDMVSRYYSDDDDGDWRDEATRLVDIGEEYGHSVMWLRWKGQQRLEKVSISAADLSEAMMQAALAEVQGQQQGQDQMSNDQMTNGAEQSPDPSQSLPPAQVQMILMHVQQALAGMIADPKSRGALVDQLLQYDPLMPRVEAQRVAREFQKGKDADYLRPYTYQEGPEGVALRPFIDVFYPATTTRIRKSKWIAIPEWLTDVELRVWVEMGWNASAVETIIETYAGATFDMSTLMGLSEFDWALSGGNVGWGVRRDALNAKETKLYQVVHVYYLATSLGNVPAMYHTVIHGQYDEAVLFHEVCPYVHGAYPCIDHVRERKSTFLLESRGVGEVSFTVQNQLKTHTDLCDDNASITINPPLEMDKSQIGQVIRPGRQIPRKQTGVNGGITPLKVGGDPQASLAVQAAAIDRMNLYWGRGMVIDPAVKLARRQVMVRDFLSDMKRAEKLVFALIQQFAPDSLKSTFIGGLPADLNVSREELQGEISMQLTYDAADLDPEVVKQKLTTLREMILPMDTEGLIPVNDILRVAFQMLFPAFARQLSRDPNKVQDDEVKDESDVLGKMMLGVESPYIPGKNHQARLQYLQGQITAPSPVPGQPTPIQSQLQDPTKDGLVKKRVQFHMRQMQQTGSAAGDNPAIGRSLVKPLMGS